MIKIITKPFRFLYSVTSQSFLILYNIIRKTEIKKCGKGTEFHGFLKIRKPENLVLGRYVQVGSNCRFYSDGGIEIGDHTQIAPGVIIYSLDHEIHGRRLPYDENYLLKKVTIGRNVWIGADVKITPGVKIGEGAVIGMGTVVSKDVPPLSIIVGQPYRIIKKRDKKHYQRLCKEKRFAGKNGVAVKH